MKNEFLAVTIAGTRFSLTQREAEILSERMRAALQLPHTPATFARHDSDDGASIQVERIGKASRATMPTPTDC